ncbi:MAG: hypothetical protein M3Z05_01355 [Gemmatimonadota bacterium]|nr:hypothetical protein [Gemmatimonadota bacterium]
MSGWFGEFGYMLPDPIPALKQQLADAILASVASLNVTNAVMVLEIDSSRLANLRHRHQTGHQENKTPKFHFKRIHCLAGGL